MNNLYEFGGSCNVIIRCNSERTIGGKTYLANEPYTILENVYCSLQYKNTISEGGAKNNVLATRVGLPDFVNITNVVLNDKINCLIAEKISPQTIGHIYYCEAQDNTIWLPEAPIKDSVFVYYKNNKVNDFVIEEDKIIGDFVDDEGYLVFYDIKSQYACFDFTTPHYGYFTLEIIGRGNQDKISDQVYIKLPAVSLMSVPVFDLINGTLLHAPLQFKCIHQNQQKPYFNIGD